MSDIMGTLKFSKDGRSYFLKIYAIDKYKIVDENGKQYDFTSDMMFTLLDKLVKSQKPYMCEHSGIEFQSSS